MSEAFVVAKEKPFLHLSEWEQRFPGLVAGFTIRTGGESEQAYESFNMGLHVGDDPARVIANRKRLADAVGMPFSAWTCAEQIHGNRVCQVVAGGAGKESLEDVIPAADGLFTDRDGVLLTSFYADCVPLYFLDPASKAIGLAHAGWKGTVGRIAVEMIEALRRQFGTKPEELLVAIGPAIGGCCYEVDERIMEQVRISARDWQQAVTASANEERYMLDLRRLNEAILTEAGIDPARILRTEWCTSCRTDLFYSHRKEAGKEKATGRMASFIGWSAGNASK
ncbi:peptidoglycan editing factor PgeF [Brevibacillus sp. TJ4]|uniref:peptidoglycan editing factor PgeF n=1 Tax=Brevibacillus sp. TJ4 TaxID=3234853 RepID=UPI0037D19303